RADASRRIEYDDVRHPEAVTREPAELVGEDVERTPRLVDPDAEDIAAEAREARGQRLRLGGTQCDRGEDVDRGHGGLSPGTGQGSRSGSAAAFVDKPWVTPGAGGRFC